MSLSRKQKRQAFVKRNAYIAEVRDMCSKEHLKRNKASKAFASLFGLRIPAIEREEKKDKERISRAKFYEHQRMKRKAQ